MKKFLIMLLALLAVLALMTGCAKEPEELVIEEPDWDAILGTESTEEEEAPVEEDNSLTILNQIDDSLRTNYNLLAVDGGNTAGADAFVHWIYTREGLSVADTIGNEQFGQRLFFISHDVTSLYKEEIPSATEQTKVIRLAVTDFLGSDILLDTVLPAFEAAYGYTVEVLTDGTDGADLILTHEAEPETDSARVVDGQESEIIPFLYNHYILCGPTSDPAGIRNNEVFTDGIAAIAMQQLPFISRGDGSAVHQRELTLWPEERGITQEESSFADYEWYHSAKADMAQCLSMAEELGAYVLTDRLSLLEFQQAQ